MHTHPVLYISYCNQLDALECGKESLIRLPMYRKSTMNVLVTAILRKELPFIRCCIALQMLRFADCLLRRDLKQGLWREHNMICDVLVGSVFGIWVGRETLTTYPRTMLFLIDTG